MPTELLVGLCVLAISGIAFVAYNHPEIYGRYAVRLVWWLLTAAIAAHFLNVYHWASTSQLDPSPKRADEDHRPCDVVVVGFKCAAEDPNNAPQATPGKR